MFGCGQTNPDSGSCRSQEERGPCLKTGTTGHPRGCQGRGGSSGAVVMAQERRLRCWTRIGLGADLAWTGRDWAVRGGLCKQGAVFTWVPGVHWANACGGIFWPILEHPQHSPPSPGPDFCPGTLRGEDDSRNPIALPNEHLGERKGCPPSKPGSGWIKPNSYPCLTRYHGEREKMPPHTS